MPRRDRGLDFITLDGGEGGTGAGPLVFAAHVALPFKLAFSRVYRVFAEAGLCDDVVFVGSASWASRRPPWSRSPSAAT